MTERDVIISLAWIIGIGITVLGIILRALAGWIVRHIEELKSTINVEMRAFDVRLARVEMITGMRRGEDIGMDRRGHDD